MLPEESAVAGGPGTRAWPAPTPSLALSPGTPDFASSPCSCSRPLPLLFLWPEPPLAFLFLLSCWGSGGRRNSLHLLLPRPPGLGPKASPSGSAPYSSPPFPSRHLQGTGPGTGIRQKCWVPQQASQPLPCHVTHLSTQRPARELGTLCSSLHCAACWL